ncbi:MAG: hypothetical protein EXQ48_03080 [Acidobacteria bacterium]|nr:hypothetical protein [Acidobacteriota bacterium]
MDPFLFWLESTALSVWVRESTSVFAFPAILSAHAIGMGLAAGIGSAIALLLLGVGPGIPTSEMRRFVPVLWFGFWMNAVSGVMLLIGYPTKALTNPVFYLKLSFVALAMWIFTVISRWIFRDPVPKIDGAIPKARFLAVAALVCWAGAIISGRLLAYTHNRLLVGF